jgi:decaprenylphospho-beta-D-ribofuranose 2-oxidase
VTNLHGWGRFPSTDVEVVMPLWGSERQALVHEDSQSATPGKLIPRGLGRSYGDSALAQRVLSTRYLDHFRAFDPATGLLTCEAGVSLDSILRTFVPRGWFLPVAPGTRFVTVGGAIASDVHGKNHHGAGTFGQHVRSIEVILGNGEHIAASPVENADLFHATCSGMGMTGLIRSAVLQLKHITTSDIIETTVKTPNLEATLEAFASHTAMTYSVAWIDCLARGTSLGRSLLKFGEHAPDGPLQVQSLKAFRVPFDLPASFLNQFSARVFNAVYYGQVREVRSLRKIPFEPFFFPLDTVGDWNRLYGKPGFLQYQFVLPREAGKEGLKEVLDRIACSGQGSFLAVLKVLGPSNKNLLSFPMEGYTLALDFKAEPSVFELLDDLDAMVTHHGGRTYLAKDARMTEATFKQSYRRWEEFEEVRHRWHASGKFSSRQSKRLGLL